jgi:RNA polymerase sigma-70 factor (sigma-E family)
VRVAHQLTHDHAAAEDLLQTALAKVWRVWSRLDGDPEPYVRKVLFTTYASWWRTASFQERPTAALPDAGESSTADAQAESDRMWRALARLSRRQRAVIVARYYLDLSEAQAADLLGCSIGSVKTHASRALATLRRCSRPARGPSRPLRSPSPSSRST